MRHIAPIRRLRTLLARLAIGRARRREHRAPRSGVGWLRLACRLSPRFGMAHRELFRTLFDAGDRLGALDAAQAVATRFPDSPDAWVLLGRAYRGAYRTRDALVAYEHALAIEERPDAAMAAGELYRLLGDHQTAGARFARAYAAGAGPDALRENARELEATGDPAAAKEAIAMWEKETGKAWGD